MSRELTRAEQVMLAAIAEETPAALRAIVNQLVPPKNMVSAGATIAPTTAVTETSVRIPDSYIGQKYGQEEGLFLGYFDLGNGVGEKPIFVVELTKKDLTFNQTVEATSALPNGYVADPYIYDARQGLREGKTVIAPHDMLKAVCREKDKFQEMFKKVGWVLSSSPHPDYPDGVRVVGFRGGGVDWHSKYGLRAPSLLLRTALTL